jgi:hypothetical protein
MNHAGRHDNRFAFGDFATGRWESKPRSTGKQPHDFVAGMEMRPETPGELTTLDDFQRPSVGLANGEGCTNQGHVFLPLVLSLPSNEPAGGWHTSR